MPINRVRSYTGLLITFMMSGAALAGGSAFQEQGQLIRAPRALGALGENLFGDETNFYSGSLSFVQTDISLPGNNALQVGVSRRLNAGNFVGNRGQFGYWDLEIPHMHGVFASSPARGWTVPIAFDGNNKQVVFPGDRCSSFGAPPDADGMANDGSIWSPKEFWHGNHLTVPGHGTQEVLLRAANNLNIPADGNTYNLVTKNQWAIRCLSQLASSQRNPVEGGEGFLAVAPDGTQYRFDWMATRSMPNLSKGQEGPALNGNVPAASSLSAATPNGMVVPENESGITAGTPVEGEEESRAGTGVFTLTRSEVWFLPTLITDKFGNTVRYVWDPVERWKLLQIIASDGRQLTFTHLPDTYLIATVSDGSRTWTYNYSNLGAVNTPSYSLSGVTNPDGSKWQVEGLNPLLRSVTHTAQSCEDAGFVSGGDLTGSLTHPSGAVGTFTMSPTMHGRSYVPKECSLTSLNMEQGGPVAMYPRYFSAYSITAKSISGPGLPLMNWRMSYSAPAASWRDCSSNCVDNKTVLVTDPKSQQTRYTFGTRFNVNEGLLLQTDLGWDGSSALRSIRQVYRSPTAGPYANEAGTSEQDRGDAQMNAQLMPVEQRITTQQGVTFTWLANEFDTKARTTSVTRASSLGTSRTETTSYQDITAKWVLSLVKNVTEASTSLVMQANSYDPANGNLLTTRHFGHLDETRTYYADGTLATKADGKGQTTSFSNYKLGLAQNVTYADNSSESAVVNNLGLITSTTDAAGFTTYYDYDAAGRLNLIRYPAGDAVAWNDTTITTEQVFGNEYDLAAGHWKQTVATGDARSVSYLDAFWRPVLSRTYDQGVGAESLTSKMIVRQFDHKGKTTFESYPQRTISSINTVPGGVSTQYDALSRPTQTLADSELGKLRTSIEYLSGFQKRVTNARNRTSTSSFQAFDEPSENALIAMQMPEGVSLSITRDVFGKPLAISRRGSFDGNVNINTRNYVYDPYQRLCKTIEPEVGVMKQQLDDANNVQWRANGTSGTSLTECYLDNVQAAEKVSYSYDAQNRLLSTSFGDNSPAITRTWTPDGLPETISSGGTTWTTYYNRRRLPVSETLTLDGKSYPLGWSYNVNGHLDSLTYPNGLAISYTPNALGEPTRVDKFATGISYFPNGAIAGFTYGNGIVHSLSLNARNLPYQAKDAGVLLDTYGFDENGNVTGISDQQESISDRSMSYDGLDRLVSANAPKMWGLGSFRYDALDNLRTSAVGARNSTHNYDLTGTNRLDNINSNGVVTSYQYDNLGNIIQRGNQGFTFDRGNRLKSASGKGTYLYDGLGHRSKITGSDGSIRIQVYSPAGQLLYGTTSLPGKPATSTNYIYLHHGLIAEVNQ